MRDYYIRKLKRGSPIHDNLTCEYGIITHLSSIGIIIHWFNEVECSYSFDDLEEADFSLSDALVNKPDSEFQ